MDIDYRETYHDRNRMSTTYVVILLKNGKKATILVLFLFFTSNIVDSQGARLIVAFYHNILNLFNSGIYYAKKFYSKSKQLISTTTRKCNQHKIVTPI